MIAPLFELENIVQRFGEREVLSIDSLRMEEGEIYALLGPNGAGKTTLMKILAFLDAPYSGNLYFKGQLVTSPLAAELRSRVVWSPQSPVMFTGTALYNVMYPMRIKGVHKKEAAECAMELLQEVRLEHLAKAQATGLSGGETQRVSAARAMAAGAEVILFDEPTANLDYQARQEMQELIHSLWKKRKISLLITTHDVRLAKELCRNIITLDDGKVSAKAFLPEDMILDAAFNAEAQTLFHACEELSDRCEALVVGLARNGRYVVVTTLCSGREYVFRFLDENRRTEVPLRLDGSIVLEKRTRA